MGCAYPRPTGPTTTARASPALSARMTDAAPAAVPHSLPAGRPAIAFFDLDKTLIGINSAQVWLRAELRAGLVRRRDAARGAVWIGLYHAGFARLDAAVRDAALAVAGAEVAPYAARSDRFWAEVVLPSLRPGARAAVEAHRAAGERLALITSSSQFLAGPAAAALGLDHALSNVLLVEGDRFTGRMAEPLCFGAGKVAHAEALAAATGHSLADCAFYTDSYSDLPLMQRVGRPVAVHPDPRLRRAAQRQGWPVVDWGAPGAPGAR